MRKEGEGAQEHGQPGHSQPGLSKSGIVSNSQSMRLSQFSSRLGSELTSEGRRQRSEEGVPGDSVVVPAGHGMHLHAEGLSSQKDKGAIGKPAKSSDERSPRRIAMTRYGSLG